MGEPITYGPKELAELVEVAIEVRAAIENDEANPIADRCLESNEAGGVERYTNARGLARAFDALAEEHNALAVALVQVAGELEQLKKGNRP